MAEIVGMAFDAITLIAMLPSLFPGGGGNNVGVRIAAGLDQDKGLYQGGGSIYTINVLNENQQSLSHGFLDMSIVSGDLSIKSGEFSDFKIDIGKNKQQTPYVEIQADNDAICIPYVTTTWVDGSKYGFDGSTGKECGLDWYYSNIFVDSSNYKPFCFWLDRDHTNGLKANSVIIKMTEFAGSDDKKSRSKQSFCGFPALRAYKSIDGIGHSVGPIFKRDEHEIDLTANITRRDGPSQHPNEDRLIVSPHGEHSAIELCNSATAYGPDFVSKAEGVHCDMKTHTATPICSEGVDTDCFHLESTRMRRRDGSSVELGYGNVVNW